jgi:hypothetical protein
MPDRRSGILWVMDGAVGHLAIAHRGGFLRQIYGRPSMHFRNADDALASIDTDGVPAALLVGFALTSDVGRLLADPRLQDVPFLIADRPDRRGESSQWRELDNVYRAPETMDLFEALENFSVNVVNTTTPRWPCES